METPSSTFRLERVRSLRERAKEHAREELARELQLRMRGEAMLREAAYAVGVTNVHDPAETLEGGAKYLRRQLDRFGGDVARALAAYNAGPGAVDRFGGVPPDAETQNYVRRVQAYAAEFRTASPAPTAAVSLAAAPVSSSPSVNGIL